MRVRPFLSPASICVLALGACVGGSVSPPALAYRLPNPTDITYDVLDTATVGIEALGQAIEFDVGSAAVYGLTFAQAGDGVRVTLSVEDLQATLVVPLTGPIEVDESSVAGDLVFTLDRRGEATVESVPRVDGTAGQLVPALQIANSFFPALPGGPVRPGDTWLDTISYGNDGDTGGATQRAVLEYTAVGDTVIDGTSLLHITFDGTADVGQALSMQGAEIQQSTNLALSGHVLWDLQGGMMFERRTVSIGTGRVRLAMLPDELPTRFEAVSNVRLKRE
jgi:hypothetical protein